MWISFSTYIKNFFFFTFILPVSSAVANDCKNSRRFLFFIFFLNCWDVFTKKTVSKWKLKEKNNFIPKWTHRHYSPIKSICFLKTNRANAHSGQSASPMQGPNQLNFIKDNRLLFVCLSSYIQQYVIVVVICSWLQV